MTNLGTPCLASNAQFDVRQPLNYQHFSPAGFEGSLTIYKELTHPVTVEAAKCLEQPHLVLLGFSVGNGYFSRRRVEIAVAAFAHLSDDVVLLVPDAISVHTYRALDYGETGSRSRVKKHGVHMVNRVKRAMTLAEATNEEASLRLFCWETHIAHLPELAPALTRVETLMENSARFRSDVMATARSVLEGRREGPFTEAAIREAANYLIAELAFISISAEYFGAHIVVPYYRPFHLGANFCAGLYGEPVRNVSWAVYNIELTTDDVTEEASLAA